MERENWMMMVVVMDPKPSSLLLFWGALTFTEHHRRRETFSYIELKIKWKAESQTWKAVPWLTCFIHDLIQTKCTSVEMVDWVQRTNVTMLHWCRCRVVFPNKFKFTQVHTDRQNRNVCAWLSKKKTTKNQRYQDIYTMCKPLTPRKF